MFLRILNYRFKWCATRHSAPSSRLIVSQSVSILRHGIGQKPMTFYLVSQAYCESVLRYCSANTNGPICADTNQHWYNIVNYLKEQWRDLVKKQRRDMWFHKIISTVLNESSFNSSFEENSRDLYETGVKSRFIKNWWNRFVKTWSIRDLEHSKSRIPKMVRQPVFLEFCHSAPD